MFRFLFALLVLQFMPVARAETPVALYESFAGNVNFAGTQKTIRTGSNQWNPCGVVGQNTDVLAALSGIPAGATILRAHLYWAGSGSAADYNVQLDRNNVSATADRQYSATANGRSYFGGAADVTSRVASKGNGTYRFRRLSVDNQGTYCQVEGVTGGFALLVVYSHPSEPFRVLNLYEGFQPTYYSRVDLSLSNFRIPDPIGTATGRIGHITWEGDSTLGNTNAENLFFNDYEMTDARNPRYNQFNSSSNINNDSASYGIDFDAYTVSSPVIQSGQTTATTRYQSGQDLVLLHSEVIAVPNVPVADLSVGMTVDSPVMTQGVGNAYQVSVGNNGPMAEPGPVVVTDNIHPALTVTSATGAGWSCTVSGQLVTCTWSGAVTAGTTLNPITISVTPPGTPPVIENTVAVSGQNFDNNTGNNTATVTTCAAAADYVFTDRPCLHNIPFSSGSQPCKIYVFGDRTAGTPISSIYITALNSSGVPSRLHWLWDRTVSFYFGTVCINPTTTAGTAPTFTAVPSSGNKLRTCDPSGPRQPLTGNSVVTFPGGSPSSSVGYTFAYDDVGVTELYFVDSGGKSGSSGPFNSLPAKIALTSVKRNSDNAVNQAPETPDGAGFVAAGENFSMTIASLSSMGRITPNFGREIQPEKFSVSVGGAIDSTTGAVFAEMVNFPTADLGDWGPVIDGSATGNAFSWDEVGILRLVPGTLSGNYMGKALPPGEAVNVGRFYPHHFDTAVEEPLPGLCPSSATCTFGSAYAKQPFIVEVTARNADGVVTQNYQGRFARQVELSAWNGAGGTVPPPGGSTLLNPMVIDFISGIGSSGTPSYALPNPFSSEGSAARALNWLPPTTIYLRAEESSGLDGVTSNVGATSEEAPIWIVAGRLQVANAFGSDLLNLPVRVTAQYWTGSRWANSVSDDVSVVTPVNGAVSNLEFFDCSGQLAANCSLVPYSAAAFTLSNGVGTLRLLAPGAGRRGGARLRVRSPTWLPSTVGQLVFGQRKAPLDYIREVY
ncbi:MAG TPA: DUF11 domain-containing protein [Telluria sp.]